MSRSQTDRRLRRGLQACAGLTGGITLLIIGFLILESLPALNQIGITRFFTDDGWHPLSTSSQPTQAAAGEYNLVPMLIGTLLTAGLAVLLATPLGIGSAVFCHYYAPQPLAAIYRRLIELLAGIPSVVYGLWGLVVLVPLIGRLHAPGPSLLAGGLILALMILPTVALAADAAFAGIPATYLQSAAALGLSRWGTVRGVIFPAARSGLWTGIILQTGRALGETMAVVMVCGNVVQVPHSVFAPVRTLTANIALEMAYAMGNHRSALFVSGLILTLLVIVLVSLTELFRAPLSAARSGPRSVIEQSDDAITAEPGTERGADHE